MAITEQVVEEAREELEPNEARRRPWYQADWQAISLHAKERWAQRKDNSCEQPLSVAWREAEKIHHRVMDEETAAYARCHKDSGTIILASWGTIKTVLVDADSHQEQDGQKDYDKPVPEYECGTTTQKYTD